jgi:ketosteroid isomerase-like protein
MSDDNATLLRETYEAFGRGDIPTVLSKFSEDIHWNAPEVLPHGMHVHGPEAVGGFFEQLGAMWKDFELEMEVFVASGDRVCVIGKANGTIDGTTMTYGFVHAWTVRDGVLVTFDEFVDPDDTMLRAYGDRA